MAHRAIWRCRQACMMGYKCTVKAWNEEPPRNMCLYNSEWSPVWERYEAKNGQRRLGGYI